MGLIGGGAGAPSRRELAERIERLEAEIAELRRHQVRVAELADLVQELLIPMAQRDEERVEAAIARLQGGL